MREILTVHSIPKGLSFLMGLVSLGLLVCGVYGDSYWSGCGLVLLMTSLLFILSLKDPDPH